MHYLPNNYDNVLKFDKYTNPVNKYAYPILLDGAMPNSGDYKTYKNIDNKTCENNCLSDVNHKCEHYFFVNKKDNTTVCYTDSAGDSSPFFTTNNNDISIKDSTLYKKQYRIKTTCGTVEDNQAITYIPNTTSTLNTFSLDYRLGQNAPNLTYYCSLDRYLQDNNAMLSTYKKNYTEGMTTGDVNMAQSNIQAPKTAQQDANFHSNAPYVDTAITQKYPQLNAMVKQYSDVQDKIGERYDQTLSSLKQYIDISNQMVSPQYKFNGTDSIMPDKFYNNPNPKPDISLMDGMKRDVGVMLLQQNTMYTVASIAAATCLGLAMFFGGE
jgi:hypothetical protein